MQQRLVASHDLGKQMISGADGGLQRQLPGDSFYMRRRSHLRVEVVSVLEIPPAGRGIAEEVREVGARLGEIRLKARHPGGLDELDRLGDQRLGFRRGGRAFGEHRSDEADHGLRFLT